MTGAMLSLLTRRIISSLFLLALVCLPAIAQKAAWRQATDTELASVLPSRAHVESEHIETEMRTASGIVNAHGRYIAGVVLLTAGYSAEGKYSHYLVVQVPVSIGGVKLAPGNYVFGWTRSGDTQEVLHVHFNAAETGEQVGAADARWIAKPTRVSSLHIWPPNDKSLIQIGRFGIPYKLGAD
jgi:hypothetical protein